MINKKYSISSKKEGKNDKNTPQFFLQKSPMGENAIENKIAKLFEALLKSWKLDTCYPAWQEQWNSKNPAFGQCAITALVVQDYFGGILLHCKHHNHYWNQLLDGTEIDLSRSQFLKSDKICADEVRTRNYILNSEHAKEVATLVRYRLLKKRVWRLYHSE